MPPKGLIRGSDASGEATRAARANLAKLPGGRTIDVEKLRFEDIERLEGVTIATNPPYGVRLGDVCEQLAFVLPRLLERALE